MATDFKAIQAEADALLEAGVAKSASFQDAYLATHGRYAQCVETPSVIPKDGAKLATDENVKPFYQQEAWDDLGFTLPTTAAISMRIDAIEGPNGKDWAATVRFVADGIAYSKTTAGVGVEVESTDWVSVRLDDPVVTGLKATVDVGAIGEVTNP